MINLGTVTRAIQTQLNAATALADYVITREEPINEDQNISPWVGIYRGRLGLKPQTIGRGALNWAADASPVVAVQVRAGAITEESSDELDDAVNAVLTAIDSDRTLQGTVAQIVGYDIEHKYTPENESSFFTVTALITVRCEKRT